MIQLAIEIPYWGQSLLRVLGGLVAVLLPAGAIVYLFLFKMMSFMQSRLGPMEAGPYGSLQLVAEVGKWMQKEDLAPEAADKSIFKIAPLVVLLSTFLLVVVIPFGPDALFTDFEVGIFYGLAVASVSVLGILIAGWASANKYALLGGLRAAGQLIAYELPMVLAVLGVVIQAGSMNMQQIVVVQNTGSIFGVGFFGNPFIITQPEFLRRMKEMQQTGGGGIMGMGNFPEMYNLVVNTNSDLMQKILKAKTKRGEYINQALDLARLSQNLLQGKEMTNFIKRSYELMNN